MDRPDGVEQTWPDAEVWCGVVGSCPCDRYSDVSSGDVAGDIKRMHLNCPTKLGGSGSVGSSA